MSQNGQTHFKILAAFSARINGLKIKIYKEVKM